jgi:hypothetical protein
LFLKLRRQFILSSSGYGFVKYIDVGLLPILFIYQWNIAFSQLVYLPLVMILPHILVPLLAGPVIDRKKSSSTVLFSVASIAFFSFVLIFLSNYTVFLVVVFVRSLFKTIYQPAIHKHIVVVYHNDLFVTNKLKQSWEYLSAFVAILFLSLVLFFVKPHSVLAVSFVLYCAVLVSYLSYFKRSSDLLKDTSSKFSSANTLATMLLRLRQLMQNRSVAYLTWLSIVLVVLLALTSLVLPKLSKKSGISDDIFALMSSLYYLGGFLYVSYSRMSVHRMVFLLLSLIVFYTMFLCSVHMAFGVTITLLALSLWFMLAGFTINAITVAYFTLIHQSFPADVQGSLMAISNAVVAIGILCMPLLGQFSLFINELLIAALMGVSVILVLLKIIGTE